MGDLVFVCDQCAKKMVVVETAAHAQVVCPACEAKTRVPSPEIRFRCPLCNIAYSAPADMKDDSIDCPNCGGTFIVGSYPEKAASLGGTCVGCAAPLDPDVIYCVKCGVHQETGKRRGEGTVVAGQGPEPSGLTPERAGGPAPGRLTLIERCLPGLKAVTMLCCIVAAGMAALHYYRLSRNACTARSRRGGIQGRVVHCRLEHLFPARCHCL